MKRREFIGLIGGTAVLPLVARAQQPKKLARVGYLGGASNEGGRILLDCFRNKLNGLGWIEGTNINFEYRWTEGVSDRSAKLADELLSLNLDLIVATSTPGTQAFLKNRTTSVVFIGVSDPVAGGIVESLARPGRNFTGMSNFLPATTAKLLEILKTVVPGASRFGILNNPANAGKILEVHELEKAARALGLQIEAFDVRSSDDLDSAFSNISQARCDALITLQEGVTLTNRSRIVEYAENNRLPAIYQIREFVAVGGLMSYGLNYCDHFGRAAVYVDKILKGARPADLPVEQPTKFELVVNLKAAKAIGLTFPETLLLLADEVIE